MLDGEHAGRDNLGVGNDRSDMLSYAARVKPGLALRSEEGRPARGETLWYWRPTPSGGQASG